VKAFDLWATMTPTSDGGVAFVSTKQTGTPLTGLEFSNTDAYVAKLTRTLSVSWDFTYEADTERTHSKDGDKSQECLYGIAVSPNGGYVISGNNSSNYDDDYSVWFGFSSSQTVNYTTAANQCMRYWGPDDLTLSPDVTFESTTYARVVARNSITIGGPFKAELGATLKVEIEPGFSGVIPKLIPESEPLQLTGAPLIVDLESETASDDEKPEFALGANYPDPFNPRTTITFSLPEQAHVHLSIYNLAGQEVGRLVDSQLGAGQHRVQWDGSSLPSGVYLYRLEAGALSLSRTMTLLK